MENAEVAVPLRVNAHGQIVVCPFLSEFDLGLNIYNTKANDKEKINQARLNSGLICTCTGKKAEKVTL